MASEQLFTQQVEKFLTDCGIYQAGTPRNRIGTEVNGWFTKIWGGGYQKAGIPDILASINGVFVSIELKSMTGKPSALQVKNTNLIGEGGGIGIILYPDGFDDFKEVVKGVIKCNCPTVGLKPLLVAHTSSRCVISKVWK